MEQQYCAVRDMLEQTRTSLTGADSSSSISRDGSGLSVGQTFSGLVQTQLYKDRIYNSAISHTGLRASPRHGNSNHGGVNSASFIPEVGGSVFQSTCAGFQKDGRRCRTRSEGPRCWINEAEAVRERADGCSLRGPARPTLAHPGPLTAGR